MTDIVTHGVDRAVNDPALGSSKLPRRGVMGNENPQRCKFISILTFTGNQTINISKIINTSGRFRLHLMSLFIWWSVIFLTHSNNNCCLGVWDCKCIHKSKIHCSPEKQGFLTRTLQFQIKSIFEIISKGDQGQDQGSSAWEVRLARYFFSDGQHSKLSFHFTGQSQSAFALVHISKCCFLPEKKHFATKFFTFLSHKF